LLEAVTSRYLRPFTRRAIRASTSGAEFAAAPPKTGRRPVPIFFDNGSIAEFGVVRAA
jgi:hypothetical protein